MAARLEFLKLIPYGFIVTRSWLMREGVKRHTIDNWLKSGKLISLAAGVYIRPDSPKPKWQNVICSLQRMGMKITPGGLTAIEMLGRAHYLPLSENKLVYLYGSFRLPAWVKIILPNIRFIQRNSLRIFTTNQLQEFSMELIWSHDEWPLIISAPERAFFEIFYEMPDYISFEHAHQLIEGANTLCPKKINALLKVTKNIKTKRLFLWFAERHQHTWLKHLDKYDMNSGALGSGNAILFINQHWHIEAEFLYRCSGLLYLLFVVDFAVSLIRDEFINISAFDA